MRSLPAPRFEHLVGLSDDVGLLEHADHDRPRHSHGYCVDDAARALVVLGRHPGPARPARDLLDRCLGVVVDAESGDGRFRNRLAHGGGWTDEPGTGDWWGRATWGLAVVGAHHADARPAVAPVLDRALGRRSPHPRATAHAMLGAALARRAGVRSDRPLELLVDGADLIRRYWPLREGPHRLTYANAVLPEALLAAGEALDDAELLGAGLRRLEALVVLETRPGHLSVTPVGGWAPGEDRPGFDQQPLEVHHLAEAALRAWRLTGDDRWRDLLGLAAAWFLGDNDVGVPLYDPGTGAGHDGLTPTGRNENRGAESTLAALATLQLARRDETRRPTPRRVGGGGVRPAPPAGRSFLRRSDEDRSG